MKIFVSYNHNDSEIVDVIARKLAQIFGQENIFYDKWSIQPGDQIIEKMNQGLTEQLFFLFFASKNSLQSGMVKLEWQNALMNAVNKSDRKFIPIKLDDCLMPSILLQTCYISVYSIGLENAIRQLIDVISGKNTYNSELKEYQNLRGYLSKENNGWIVEFRAETYLEPISRYIILVDNNQSEVAWKAESDSMYHHNFAENLNLSNGIIANGIFISVERGTAPGFPFIIRLSKKGVCDIRIRGLMRAKNSKEFMQIPMIEGKT